MRRSFLGRAIPAALTTLGVAVSTVTAATIMVRAMTSGTAHESAAPAASSSGGLAPLPASSGGTTSSTATPAAATATPKPVATATPQPTAVTTRTIAGPVVEDRFGAVQATITVTGTRITNVSITAPEDDPRSAAINEQAVPVLQAETLQAQSANVDVVSGATYTTEAYIQSLQGALQTAGL